MDGVDPAKCGGVCKKSAHLAFLRKQRYGFIHARGFEKSNLVSFKFFDKICAHRNFAIV